ncbi:GNAT family N-acetyltransferase [Nocardioides sp. CN2-186]|uniref:GNAT family N-acetyltransferase n=1 Tax=Nocardioides tweenelious TaxID=3156607 RepID=UPI0032B4FC80
MADVATSHNPAEHRYEGHIDGKLAGFAAYELTYRLVIFTHTEVDDAYEGRGVGSAIAKFALDDVRSTGTHRVLPLCPFIKSWIARHPDYADLVDGVAPTSDGE